MSPDAPWPERVRGIVYDLDGTLVDSYRAITESLNHAREAFGLEPLPDEIVRRRVGRGLEVLIAEMVGTDRVEAGVRLFRERYATAYVAGTFLLPGVAGTLRELGRRGFVMTVASNKPARFGRAILAELGLLELFETIQGPDLAGSTKPDPAMIRLCLEAMHLGPREAVYVGDMVLDAESGRRAGVPVVLVPGGSSDEEALRATGRPVLGSLGDLLALLPGRAPRLPQPTEGC
jgi:HAD superfamily hydrolase (TIGR01509 family)